MSVGGKRLWRVAPVSYDAFVMPDWGRQGKGRYDCPLSDAGYRVLYCAESPKAACYEVLQRYRMALSSLRSVQDASPLGLQERDDLRGQLLAPTGHVPASWLDDRLLCSASFHFDGAILSVSSAAVLEQIRYALADHLITLEVTDLDLSGITSLQREVTQQISLWAWQQGYAGISYVSRFGADLTCYALFEERYELVGTPDCIPVGKSDDLLDAADTLRLHFLR